MANGKGNRLIILMTIAVLGGFGVILAMNMAALFGFIPAKYLSHNDVRGIAVEHNSKLYTLNFSQQNSLIDIFNRSLPVAKTILDDKNNVVTKVTDVQKIIVYRFDQPDIEVIPIAYVNNTKNLNIADDKSPGIMIYSVPLWNPDGYLKEAEANEMYQLLHTSYDHH